MVSKWFGGALHALMPAERPILTGGIAMMKKILVSISILALACTLSVAVHAMTDAPKQLTVPAGDLVSALQSLSRQVDVRLVYQAQQLAGMKTQGFSGLLTAQQAVGKLLQRHAATVPHRSGRCSHAHRTAQRDRGPGTWRRLRSLRLRSAARAYSIGSSACRHHRSSEPVTERIG